MLKALEYSYYLSAYPAEVQSKTAADHLAQIAAALRFSPPHGFTLFRISGSLRFGAAGDPAKDLRERDKMSEAVLFDFSAPWMGL
jgi:hypothetical protein